MISTTYRTDDGGRWGSGKGANLTPAEVDLNFWNIVQALLGLIESAPEPNNIASITQSGTTLTITLTDGTPFVLAIPVVQFRWRGDWAPSTSYLTLDAFKVDGVGIFSVLANHTSDTSFDPAAVDGSSNPLYFQMFGISTLTGLGSLLDVDLTGLLDGQIIRWDAGTGKWKPAWPGVPGMSTKTANYTVTTDDNGLHFDNIGASGEVDFALPTAAKGLTYTFIVDASHTVKLVADGSDNIAVGGGTPAGTLQSSTPYSVVTIEAHKADLWVATALIGSWS